MVNTMKSRANGVNSEGTYAPDELVVVVEIGKKLTVASGGGVLARGTVLGKITASGKVLKSLSAAGDGSQTPYAILAEDVDATSADADAMVYMAGTFNSNFLVYGTGHSLATVFDALRAVDIHLVTGLAY